jgi:hypothetical protein
MEKFTQQLEEGYRKYVATKLNSNRSPCNFMYVNETCKAAQNLMPQYDLGIELATDGLCPGYIFHLHGFPTKAVKLGRKGRGAVWQPLEELSTEDIEGKKLLLFDNDVVTGRTLNRTVRELGKFSPEYMDLLLMHETTYLTVDSYKRWNKNHSVPAVEDSYSFKPKDIRETPEGLEVDYFRDGESWPTTIQLNNDQLLALNTRRNVPREIRKVMTIQKDFKDDTGQGIINLERILRGK